MKIPEFAMPWLFLLLIPALGAAWILFRKKQPSILFPDLRTVKAGTAIFPFKRIIPFLLILFSLILLVVALTRPREGLEEVKRRSDGVDIIIALDVSGSMRAIDIPENVKTNDQLNRGLSSGEISARLNIAKQEISKFIKIHFLVFIIFIQANIMSAHTGSCQTAYSIGRFPGGDDRRSNRNCRPHCIWDQTSERQRFQAENHCAFYRWCK